MTIPLRFGPNPHDETPMPVENLLTFTLRRFRRDVERGLGVALGYVVPVVIMGTHTDYIDPMTQTVGYRPIIGKRTKQAVVPACAITSIQFQENPTDRTLRKCFDRVQEISERPNVGLVNKTRVKTPPLSVDILMGIRFFESQNLRLQALTMAFRRHFMRHPYLYVPCDQENKDGDANENVDEMAYRFLTGDDISDLGFSFEQFVPFEEPFASFGSNANRDNLVIAESTVQISAVPFADDWVIGDFEDLNTIEIELYDKDDPEETTRARITVTEE